MSAILYLRGQIVIMWTFLSTFFVFWYFFYFSKVLFYCVLCILATAVLILLTTATCTIHFSFICSIRSYSSYCIRRNLGKILIVLIVLFVFIVLIKSYFPLTNRWHCQHHYLHPYYNNIAYICQRLSDFF